MQKNDDFRLRRRGRGFVLEGPGYYLWDEDPREVIRAASELRSGIVPPRPTQRMLVLPPRQDETKTAS